MNEPDVTITAVLSHDEAVVLARVLRTHLPSDRESQQAWYAVVDKLSGQLPPTRNE